MHKAVTGRVEAKNLLSRQRQSNYRRLIPHELAILSPLFGHKKWFQIVVACGQPEITILLSVGQPLSFS